MEACRILGAAALLMAYLATLPAQAAFHLVQIDELTAGRDGSSAVQFIELRMLADEENCQKSGDLDAAGPFGCVDPAALEDPGFSAARLLFVDAAGAPIGSPEGLGFDGNTPIGNAGRSILIGTQAFDDLPPPAPDPDFVLPLRIAPDAGKVCYKNDPSAFDVATDCLSYGAYSGDTDGFGNPAAALPVTGAVSLRRVRTHGALTNPDNATDFALGTPAPCSNSGAGLCDVDVGVIQSRLIGPVPIGENLAYALTVTNAGPAVATGVTLDDRLPSGSVYVLAAAEASTCSHAAGRVSCALGDLAVGETRTAVVVLTPTLPTLLSNTVTVQSLSPDVNPANDMAVQEIAVSCVGAGLRTLSGRVAVGDRGLARATMTILGASGCRASAITNRRGSFVFTGIADGSYTLEAARERSCTFKPLRRQVTIQGTGARARFTARCR